MLSALDCAVCRKTIRGKYFSADGKNFCSKRCIQTTWPECYNCHKKCSQYFTAQDGKKFCSKQCIQTTWPECSNCHKKSSQYFTTQDGRIFCSKTCLSTIYPSCVSCGEKSEKTVTVRNVLGRSEVYCMDCSNSTVCYFCTLPSGNYKKLPDERALCRHCANDAVEDPAEVQQIFQQVRADLARDFGFDPEHRIRLNIVDLPTLKRRVTRDISADDGKPMGVMLYTEEREITTLPGGRKKERITEKRCRIYVLHTMPRDFLIQTIAHELTHDHLRHHVGKVKDQAAEEGFCELVAALYNIRRGKAYLNRAKEKNPSPIYGAGYRKMQKLYRQTRSLSETMQHVR